MSRLWMILQVLDVILQVLKLRKQKSLRSKFNSK